MFVSNIENDNKYIDSDEYYSVDEYSPQTVVLSIIRLAGFNVGIINDGYQAAYWFYCVVSYITYGFKRKKHKHPMHISYAAIALGVDGWIRSKSLIKNQSPSLCCKKAPSRNIKTFEETNIELLYNLFQRKLKRDPEKKDLYAIFETINECDKFFPEIPVETCEIDEFIDWFGKNFKDYEFLVSFSEVAYFKK